MYVDYFWLVEENLAPEYGADEDEDHSIAAPQ